MYIAIVVSRLVGLTIMARQGNRPGT
jgi:hypothetical protein